MRRLLLLMLRHGHRYRRLQVFAWLLKASEFRSHTQSDERQRKAEKKAPARAAAESCGVWPDSIAVIAMSSR
jgi:hypothetical protein